jgi:hypothetical protein
MAKIRKDKSQKMFLNNFMHPQTQAELKHDRHIVFNFRHLCKDQGSSFIDWEKEGKLSSAFRRLEEYSGKMIHQEDSTYCIYGDFPVKSKFKHPPYITEDAQWARIHVDGKHIIGGHIVENVFYVVFLDSHHDFWITELKHT